MTRRELLVLPFGAGLALVPACRHVTLPQAWSANDLTTLAAAAEALFPATDTIGADAEWARAFITQRLRARPGLVEDYARCARTLQIAAKAHGALGFEKLSVPDRETTIQSVCSSLSLTDPKTTSEELRLRRTLAELTLAFCVSDQLGIDDATYHPGEILPRDVSLPASLGYSLARPMPDDFIARMMARVTGVGDYNRAWAAAGFPSPPGVCSNEAERTAPVKLGDY